MRTRRHVPILAAVTVTSVLLAACGRGDTDTDGTENIVIGWTPPDVTGVFQTATDFFEASAEEAETADFDIDVQTQAPEQHTDYADQIGIVEDYISQQVDVIVIAPADTETIQPAIQQANDADIPVILVNLLEPMDDVDVASYIGFDNAEAGEVSAYSALDYFGGPGVQHEGEDVDIPEDEYLDLEFWESTYSEWDEDEAGDDVEASGVIIEGISGTLFSEQRLTGFEDVLDEHGNIEIIASPIAGEWEREGGVNAAEDFLARFDTDELDFIWAASNEMALGAASVAEREGVLDTSGGDSPPDEDAIAVFSNDVTPESVEAIEANEFAAETHHGFAEWGWLGTQTAAELHCGQEVEETQDIRPRTVWEGNSDMFYPEPDLPSIDWDSIRENCD